MAPLILCELPAGTDTHDTQDWLGTPTGFQGDDATMSAAPSIQVAKSAAAIRGHCLDILTYTWWYRTSFREREVAGMEARGIRLVLGENGFPLVCEVAGGSGPAQRIFYVSQSLEDLAQKAFGGPLPGRRFSVERSVEEAPNVRVAGLFEDGPMPLGPYVYIEAEARNIVAILCRCSPAQVDEVVATEVYDLKPVTRSRVPTTDRECQESELSRPLESALRWPL